MTCTNLFLVSMMVVVSITNGFQPCRPFGTTTRSSSSLLFMTTRNADDKFSYPDVSSSSSSFGPADIDLDRARDCAENFGKCSTQEMKRLRDSLHKERLQGFMFGGLPGIVPEEAFEHRILEEELSLQLSLLQEATPPSQLFPEAEDTLKGGIAGITGGAGRMTSESRLVVGDDVDDDEPTSTSTTVGEQLLLVEETIVEENLGDALAICFVLIALIAAPQIFQL